MAISISVGQVAAVLNVLVIILQLTLPLLIALIAVALLDDANNAATWSTFGHLINSSKWPSILHTDSASRRRVSRKIVLLSLLASIASLLIAVVSAITPLGLKSDTFATDPDSEKFTYVKDSSAFGQGTTPHFDYKYDRLCGGYSFVNCPGSYAGYTTFSNKTGVYAIPDNDNPYMSSEISANITKAFTSATSSKGNTIAGLFDLEYRAFYNYGKEQKVKGDFWFDQGRPRTRGYYTFYESLILNDDIRAVEGLVVDMKKGGVGFRNHTLPSESPYGTTWSEDLLFLEPETECIDLNVTVDYTIPDPDSYDEGVAYLTDRGGFHSLTGDYPEVDISKAQSDPVLFGRAWKGGLLTLYNMLLYMDKEKTSRNLGEKYKLVQDFTIPYAPNHVTFAPYGSGEDFGTNLPSPLELPGRSSLGIRASSNATKPKYLDTGIVTVGFGGGDVVDINRIAIQAGLMLGAGIPTDADGNPVSVNLLSNRITPKTHWSQPLYSCAAALKASVKTVEFRMEGEASVANLKVENVTPRKYNANEEPTWAVEMPGLNIMDIDPLWGLVSPEYASNPSLQTKKADHFYLPAGASAIWGATTGMVGTELDANAALSAPLKAMAQMFLSESSLSGTSSFPDYSGTSNLPLFLKWQNFSGSATTAGSIINLMWTDMVANNMVGAKSLVSNNDTGNAASAEQPVTVYKQGVQYNWLYSIPGFVLVALWLFLFLVSMTLLLTGHLSIGLLRYMLNHTSAGRAITAERHEHREENHAPTQYWADTIGSEQVRVMKRLPEKKPIYESVEMKPWM